MDIVAKLIEALSENDADVISANQATNDYGKTTFSSPVKLDAAIKVKNQSVIPVILKMANEVGFHIYPISTGNNWGYGSVQDTLLSKPRIVLDLGALKKITPTSKDLGLITLQPGVTQQGLYDFLNENDWNYMVPVTGAGPNCSILSNALERGYGITPRTDHFLAVNALKAYLPHPDLCQDLFSSAISAMDASETDFIDKSFKWGLGPYIDGLFTQSNMGIVTEVTIRLAPLPEHFSSFYIRVFDENNFEEAIGFIKEFLKDFDGIVGSINLMDRSRLVSMTAKNPNGAGRHINMTSKQVSEIADGKQLPKWMIVGSIYGCKSIVKATKKELKKRVRGLGSVDFSDSLIMRAAKVLFKLPLPKTELISSVKEQLKSLDEGIEIMLGKPNQIALPLAYWRNPKTIPDKSHTMLPDRDECGLLWYAPLIPMDASKIKSFVRFVKSTTPKYGIEPLITFTNLRHDCIDSTIPIVFDLNNDEARSLAHQCLQELLVEGCKQGFVPYRINTSQQVGLDNKNIFWKTTQLLKTSIDPNNILSPLRYNP
jgi:4-cresol dehydrogenase (hydroxylating)